jgi:hypothetical protein
VLPDDWNDNRGTVMKLPNLWRKPSPGPVEPPKVSPAAPALQVMIFSNIGLPEQEFSDQTAMLRRVASFDGDTSPGSHSRISTSR